MLITIVALVIVVVLIYLSFRDPSDRGNWGRKCRAHGPCRSCSVSQTPKQAFFCNTGLQDSEAFNRPTVPLERAVLLRARAGGRL